MGIGKYFFKISECLADFFAPRRCLMCGRINPRGDFAYICESCKASIPYITGGRCLVCSEIVGPANSPNLPSCPRCLENPPHFSKSFVACSFSGVAREIVHELKYRDGAHLVKDISKILSKSQEISEFVSNATLVPVPLHRLRTLKRRFNQSVLIANAIARAFPNSGITTENILVRIRPTPTQTTLDRASRAENVRGAFAIRKPARLSGQSIDKTKRIVIVDDVMTSGATLSECARTLKAAGFKNVDAFAFAKRI